MWIERAQLRLPQSQQLLLSIYNPNRLDVAITSGQGVFKHDHEPIGHVEFPHFTIKGGAITDVRTCLRACACVAVCSLPPVFYSSLC